MSNSLVCALVAVGLLVIAGILFSYVKKHKNEARKKLAYFDFTASLLTVIVVILFLSIEEVGFVEAAFVSVFGALVAYIACKQGFLRLRFIRQGKTLRAGWEKGNLISES